MSAANSAQQQPTTSTPAWRIVALLVCFSFMTWFNRLSMPVAYDARIGPELGVSEEEIGAVYSAFLLSYLLFMTPGGWFIDRFGAKTAILVMGLGSGLFGMLTATAGLPVWSSAGVVVTVLLVIRFAMGMFSAPYYPAAARMISLWTPLRRRTLANGINQAAANIGMACAFPLFGALVDWWDWPAAFLASGLLTTFLALIWWVIAKDRPSSSLGLVDSVGLTESDVRPVQEPTIQHSISAWALFRNRNVMLLTFSYATMGYLEYLFFFWMNHYFGSVLKIDKSLSRIYSAVVVLAMAVGMIGGSWLADRLRKSYGAWIGLAAVPMAGMTLSAVFLGFGLMSEQIVWIVVWLSLAFAAVGAAEPPTWAAAVEFGGKYGGTSAAIVNTGGNLGGFIAPVLTPHLSHALRDIFGLSEQAGWQWSIALAGVFCLSGATLWLWIRPARNPTN